MKKTFIRAAVMAAIFAAAPALAHEYKLGQIEIDHPYSRAMLPGAAVGGGYLKIVNHGEADRLLRVTTSRAKSTQLHEMQMGDDVMTMREMTDGLEIPAHGVLELKPGAFHIMFMNVAEPFKEGERVKATLTFEKAGSVDVDFVVGAPAGARSAHAEHEGGHDHMAHQHAQADAHAHHDHTAHHMQAASGDPAQDIAAIMKGMFETPDAPLSVEPVVVQGEWAVAGWAQQDRGGRALLKKKGEAWAIQICSGDSLKQADALEKAGISKQDAEALAAKVVEAEKNIDAGKLALFASFEGTVMVDGGE
ncbi:copper uptake system-associated protein [Rhizobium sp. TRM95796]|uniref:copper uptake system-associated protein n=2 Tax=unclassified Rhizobium TaxID=2613769 RepID=UPI0021E6F6CB|nr:copper uptake system-associated protein [Rhizobium sp. TRM95796]MCV3767708.1 copper uptake system-associated protein [Rhizobium sp. TRM95796]